MELSVFAAKNILTEMGCGVNVFSMLWELVDDFTCNGHAISFKSAENYGDVVIDGVEMTLRNLGYEKAIEIVSERRDLK